MICWWWVDDPQWLLMIDDRVLQLQHSPIPSLVFICSLFSLQPSCSLWLSGLSDMNGLSEVYCVLQRVISSDPQHKHVHRCTHTLQEKRVYSQVSKWEAWWRLRVFTEMLVNEGQSDRISDYLDFKARVQRVWLLVTRSPDVDNHWRGGSLKIGASLAW